ncbi:MAG: glycoside hydrolase family 16 protein [Flavobacteriales bacterium]|nr:glycoside hydrolase family 16 protein [Flavobacteriales bacterium]
MKNANSSISCCAFLIGLLILVGHLDAYGQCDYSEAKAATENGTCNKNPWVIEFEDNFDGDALNLKNWQIRPHSQGWLDGTSAQEYNTLDNATVSEGMLHIAIKEEVVEARTVSWHPDDKILGDGRPNLRKFNYTSSSLWTKKAYQYGKFEIKCRIPRGKGYWPAFWTYGGAEGWNEIDVFEFWDYYGIGGKFKLDKSVQRHRTNTHYDFDKSGGHHNCPKHDYITDFSDGMHTFTLIWTPFTIEWFVDGESVRTKYRFKKGLKKIGCEDYQAGKKYKIDKAYPTTPMNIIVNVAVRAKDVSPGADDTSFPGVMDVDYIRYSLHPYSL